MLSPVASGRSSTIIFNVEFFLKKIHFERELAKKMGVPPKIPNNKLSKNIYLEKILSIFQ
jgi:hypothetical protein